MLFDVPPRLTPRIFHSPPTDPQANLPASPPDPFAGLIRPVSGGKVNYNLSKSVRADILRRVEEDTLTADQRRAVEHVFGPALVLAGAGSGKTRVIIDRIARLVALGVRPRQILAVTFTNKATNEMQQRAKEFLGPKCKGKPTIKTIHSLCSNILRHHAKELGYERPLEIVSDMYRTMFLTEALKKLPFEALETLGKNPVEELALQIGLWKNNLLGPKYIQRCCQQAEEKISQAYSSNRRPPENKFILAAAYVAYEEQLKRAEMIDIDDLLLKTYIVLTALPERERSEEIRRAWQNRYSFIMVDEYQDTNLAQAKILKALTSEENNFYAVGDDDQSIYAFRGSNVDIIRKFEKEWGTAEQPAAVYRLLMNFRSTPEIVAVGNALVSNEKGRHEKELVAAKPSGKSVQTVVHKNGADEAAWAAATIKSYGPPYNRWLILFRDQFKMKPFRTAFAEAEYKIPSRIWAGEHFTMSEVRACAEALLLAIHDPNLKSFALVPLLTRSPLRVPECDYRLISEAIDNGVAESHWDALNSSRVVKSFSEVGIERALALQKLVEQFHARAARQLPRGGLTEIGREALHALYPELTKKPDWPSASTSSTRLLTLQSLYGKLAKWEETAKHLTLNSYMGWLNRLRIRAKEPVHDAQDAVTLSTFHAAKGTEFPFVILAVSNEGVIPSLQSIEREVKKSDRSAIPEERRLMYVGLSRAMEELYVSWPKARNIGRKRHVEQFPSRFIAECGADKLYDQANYRSVIRPKQKGFFDN